MDKVLIKTFLKNISDQTFTLVFWDGETHEIGEGEFKFKIIIHNFPGKKELFADPSTALGEAYMTGDIELVGNLQEIVESIMRRNKSFLNESKLLGMLGKCSPVGKRTSERDIAHHYDIGNDFYALWLDPTMSYSCAYFKTGSDSLYDAQMNKIHHILKKLNLREGQTLLDIGCGWGFLAIEAAKKYRVRVLGITLSKEQLKKAQERIKDEGLQVLVAVKLMDYRGLEKIGLKFDHVVSVGMAEHVGKANLPLYFKNVNAVLKETGLFLLHNITNVLETEVNAFIAKYIFPGGYIPSLREELYLAADLGFHTIDIESLRLHYMKTLMHWAERFEGNMDKIETMFDTKFIRMWRLYLNACAAAFHYAKIDLHQILLSKGANNQLPLTRQYIYDMPGNKFGNR
ncbi:class I SAM-dependent methyltransferase [Flagellimonas oceani]|uniref:Class I SAM-dependent methyltransferase n=1 Tax=Flagellimonas oceani TaxID=2698672 RepID=A0A6G7J9P1_9FLAO|nr:class I SAM-dependent methyltransferase [Allomuricauda oceani]